ncbi:hypothetical protein P1P68_02310 [Streptomyces scabiei]|uniref:hypothetical protein n=1 Tax=Streptomyces scabiei TaxID=1930 RepID=UPI00299036CF|nr:hypothetical protein [Streptomyces scabiei]MDW8803668.1 hypothetical protein [Streptomyces scabiei]
MKIDARTIEAVNAFIRLFLVRVDELHTGLFFLVIPLFVIVVGAAAVALVVIAAAVALVAGALGVILMARRGIIAAAAHSAARPAVST